MEKKPTINPEQAADLAALQAAANEADASGAPVPGDAQPAPEVDLSQDIAGAISVAVATLAPMFPSLKTIYTPEVTQAAAGAIAAVCQKHGWMQGGMFAGYGEEVAAVAILAPLALTTYQGIQDDMAQAKAKQRTKLDAPAPVATVPAGTMDASAKTVTFGAPAVQQESTE